MCGVTVLLQAGQLGCWFDGPQTRAMIPDKRGCGVFFSVFVSLFFVSCFLEMPHIPLQARELSLLATSRSC
jgi:hypothetical protein